MFDWLKKKRQGASGAAIAVAEAPALAQEEVAAQVEVTAHEAITAQEAMLARAASADDATVPTVPLPPLDAPPGPDFSSVDTLAKAQELHRQGVLTPVFLMPPEFGGEDVAFNIVYVPPFAAEMKSHLDTNVIREMVAQGQATCYTAQPGYQGESFVPAFITVEASDPGSFRSVIRIWGEGLRGAA
ncbi:MAG TPA: hypothetical protein VGN52_13395 [Burkholderiales bacterium]|jgi:hypothetical protein